MTLFLWHAERRVRMVGPCDAGVVIWRTDTEATVCLPRARGCFTPSTGHLKSDAFEAFRATSCMATVAAFAPVVPDTASPPPAPFSPPLDVRASADGATQVRCTGYCARMRAHLPPPVTAPALAMQLLPPSVFQFHSVSATSMCCCRLRRWHGYRQAVSAFTGWAIHAGWGW